MKLHVAACCTRLLQHPSIRLQMIFAGLPEALSLIITSGKVSGGKTMALLLNLGKDMPYDLYQIGLNSAHASKTHHLHTCGTFPLQEQACYYSCGRQSSKSARWPCGKYNDIHI